MSDSALTPNDYKHILAFYGKPIPSNKRLLKAQAEELLAGKLCRCIKKLGTKSKSVEARSIGVCTRAVVNKKGFKRGTFTCKRKASVHLTKTKRR